MINKIAVRQNINSRYEKSAEPETKHEKSYESAVYKTKIPSETYKAYSCVSFKGQNADSVVPRNIYNTAKDIILNTSSDETIAIKDAVEILKPLNLKEKKLLEYLLACSYDSHDENVIINKKALYYSILLTGGYLEVPQAKIPNVIASSLDNENKCFSEKQFESLFNAAGQIRMTKSKSLKRPREDNYPNARKLALVHKSILTKEISQILKAEPSQIIVNINEEDIFSVDLKQEKQKIIDKLDNLKNDKKISDGLYKELCTGLKDNNFDIKKQVSDYYSLLEECTTLQEAKEIYPEIKIPEMNFEDNGNNRLLRSRLAREDKDRIGLYILKKLYIEQKKPDMIFVELDNSYPTTYQSMIKTGVDFGRLPAELSSIIDSASKMTESFRAIDTIDDRTLEFLIRRNASKESRIWAEYMGITNKYWHQVRAIAHKQKHPLTSYYQTDKLVNGYLFYLYKNQDKNVQSKNPIEQYADGKPFNKEKKAFLENIYYMHKNNYNPLINGEKFIEFKKNFDIEAMEKSLTQLERHYKNTFSNWFMTSERRKRYEEALDNSYRLVFEKMDISKVPKNTNNINVEEQTTDRLSNDELVDYIAETEDDEIQNIQTEFKTLKNTIFETNNKELINLFMQYIGLNPDHIDYENFVQYKQILDECIENNQIQNPDNAIILFKLYNTYLNYLFNENNEQVNFEDYKENIIKKYIKPDGSIDYERMSADLTAESSFMEIYEQSDSEEKTAFLNLLNKKFVSGNKNDYKTAVEIIEMYEKLPDIFKTNFYSLAASTDKVNDKIFTQQLTDMYEKISSWNLDMDEIITMDSEKIPQKIVITSKAKYEILKDCNENIERFDVLINKFFSAAQKRIGDHHGQGVKVLSNNTGYAAELKIQGSQAVGSKRLYARIPQKEDIEKYGNVKYIFDTLEKHL